MGNVAWQSQLVPTDLGFFMFRTGESANPVLAMHSVRETASVDDHIYCVGAFTQFYNLE